MLPVVLLSGGLATRMRPFTEKIPKAMIDVCDKPFIHHQLNLLHSKGIDRVILCIGYLGNLIEEYVGDGSRYGIEVTYSYDGDKLLGTGGAIKKIEDKLPESFFILYGDSFLNLDYKKIEDAYLHSCKRGLMTVYKNNDKFDSSNVIFSDNTLKLYSKKNKTSDMNYIDYGLGIINKSVLENCPIDTVFDIADVYENLSKNCDLLGYEVSERFYEIGSKEGLNDLETKLLQKNKAVFLDRDGVINPLVYNPLTNEYESPHYPEDFSVYPYVKKSLDMLKNLDFKLIIISNQPSYAKGKTSLENIKGIENILCDYLDTDGLIDSYNYCYHHPDGVNPNYSEVCHCRKPGTLFIDQAEAKFNLDLQSSYFIGDQDSDIKCGKTKGLYTVKINNKNSMGKSGKETPSDFAENLYDAVLKIIEYEKGKDK